MDTRKTSIKVTEVSKAYKLHQRKRDRIKEMVVGGNKGEEKFWALRDINFEIKNGESMGIIGKNGSGKSTLLQLICGTLSATEGKIETEGKIAALLELGSGFNPEFTGRENVFLNASRQEQLLACAQATIPELYFYMNGLNQSLPPRSMVRITQIGFHR